MRQKCVHGFATGDMVEANVPKGKEGRTVARPRCGPRLGLIQHSDAEGRHSRRRLEALPTDFHTTTDMGTRGSATHLIPPA